MSFRCDASETVSLRTRRYQRGRELPDADAAVAGMTVSGGGGIVAITAGAREGRAEFGVVAAADSATGRIVWRHGINCLPEQLIMAADERYCYIADSGSVSAVDLVTGTSRWQMHVAADRTNEVALTVSEDTLYVGANGLIAVDPATGTRKWAALPGVITGQAAVAGAAVVAAFENTVASVDRGTGAIRWRTLSPSALAENGLDPLPVAASAEVTAAPFDAGLHQSDFKDTDPSGFLVVGTADGKPRWAYQAAPGVQWRVAVAGGRVYATDGTALYAYDGGAR